MQSKAGPLLLGAVIRTFRLGRGLSQEALADLAGLHRTYVGAVERGQRNPSFRSIERILSALHVSWTDFGKALDRKEGEH